MGGPGSGSWYRWDAKSKTESQKRIDIRRLKKQGCLQRGYSGTLFWSSRGEKTGSINFRMEDNRMILSYRIRFPGEEWQDIYQEVLFETTPCTFGGFRKWFLCTRCRKRVAVIYNTRRYFLCRHCCNLTYEICNLPPALRFFLKANNFREKIGGERGVFSPIANRPKGMHHKTYLKIKSKIQKLEKIGDQAMMAKWGDCF